MRRANRSSPLRRMTRTSSASSYPLTTSAAVRVWLESMRMSSGASDQYEKPRSARSSCGLLTPRSNSTPTMFPSLSDSAISARCSKPPCTTRARSPKRSSASCAATTATGSRSMPRSRRSGRASSRSPACPPPPAVASMTVPGGTGKSRSTTSRPMTGRWTNAALTWCSPVSSGADTGSATGPPVGRCRSGFLPESDSVKSGRSKGLQPRQPGGWWRTRWPGPACQCRHFVVPGVLSRAHASLRLTLRGRTVR